jgi:phage baseplate assembly protein W
MSIDFQLAWACPHTTEEEVVSLGSDRQTLALRQPIASANLVRVLLNNDPTMLLPPGGVQSAAILSSHNPGPYDIRAGETLLSVTSSGGSYSAYLPSGRLSCDQIVEILRRLRWSFVDVSNDGGFLVLTDTAQVGPTAVLRVGGPAAISLGFDRAGGTNGRLLYPGWDMVQRPDVITNRYIRFRSPIRTNPMIKVSYTVPAHRCLRCRATFVENDLRYNAAGNLILIQNEDLLYQASLKILLTDRGSNPFHPAYGTSLRDRIGAKAISGVASLISEDVRRALTQMQTSQREQARYQQVSLKERLYRILSVQVNRHAQDPGTFQVAVSVQNASGQPVDLSIVFTVPEVVALMGSNGLMLGTERAGI